MDESAVNARLGHIEGKVEKADNDVRTLFGLVNNLAISNAKFETTLDNLLVNCG